MFLPNSLKPSNKAALAQKSEKQTNLVDNLYDSDAIVPTEKIGRKRAGISNLSVSKRSKTTISNAKNIVDDAGDVGADVNVIAADIGDDDLVTDDEPTADRDENKRKTCKGNIMERHSSCKYARCEVSFCNEHYLQQFHESHIVFTHAQRCDLVMKYLIRAAVRAHDRPYSRGARDFLMFDLRIGDQKVCEECFAAFYCMSHGMLTRLKKLVRAGKTAHVPERSFRGNQHHTPVSRDSSHFFVDKFFDEIVKSKLCMQLPSAKKSPDAPAVTYVLPKNVTFSALYDYYVKYCIDVNCPTINVNHFNNMRRHRKDIINETDKPRTATKSSVKATLETRPSPNKRSRKSIRGKADDLREVQTKVVIGGPEKPVDFTV